MTNRELQERLAALPPDAEVAFAIRMEEGVIGGVEFLDGEVVLTD